MVKKQRIRLGFSALSNHYQASLCHRYQKCDGHMFYTDHAAPGPQKDSWDDISAMQTGSIVRVPVAPHKVVAEVSKIGHYRRGDLL